VIYLTEPQSVTFKVKDYKDKYGYNPNFLGKQVPLPKISKKFLDDIAKIKNSGSELKYTHFSVVLSKKRSLAFFTAVNIDGSKSHKIRRKADVWYYDPRIDKKYQAGEWLYAGNPLDRGHLVRQLDPTWGDLETAKTANDDTFHFTNCSPQHKKFNQGKWAKLENYILDNTDKHDLKVSVFTGPVFRDDDMPYRKVRIPAEFWKVLVMRKTNKKLSATAYLQTQKNLIEELALEFAFGKYQTYQVPLTTIESLTGLDFGILKKYDPLTKTGIAAVAIKGQKNIRL